MKIRRTIDGHTAFILKSSGGIEETLSTIHHILNQDISPWIKYFKNPDGEICYKTWEYQNCKITIHIDTAWANTNKEKTAGYLKQFYSKLKYGDFNSTHIINNRTHIHTIEY